MYCILAKGFDSKMFMLFEELSFLVLLID
uniref:Uncharacterized protein n=1 Tax=Rhizophora mucronata TaxID=61149 RepID=A0A2P2PB47_RHIMU